MKWIAARKYPPALLRAHHHELPLSLASGRIRAQRIVLQGTQEYCRGTETHSLFEDDLILTAPGNGHASMRRQPGTRALVLHFPASALKFLVKRDISISFLPASQ